MSDYRVITVSVNGGAGASKQRFDSAEAADAYALSLMAELSSIDQAFVYCDGELMHRVGYNGRREHVTGPITFVKDHHYEDNGRGGRRYKEFDVRELLS